MGLELAAMAVGQGIKAYAQKQASYGAESAQTAGIAQQAADRAKANALVTGDMNSLAASNPNAARASDMGTFMDALRANSGRIGATTPAVAGADPRYAAAVTNAQDAATAHTNTTAGYLASIMAAQQQRQTEGQNMADAATGVSGIQQNAGQDAYLAQLRAQTAGTPNPWTELAGGLVSNLGTSGALGPKAMLSPAPGVVPGGSSPTGNAAWNPFVTVPK
jgi:hypothetical protein